MISRVKICFIDSHRLISVSTFSILPGGEIMLKRVYIAIFAAGYTLSGCVQTSDLYAVRQWEKPATLQPDDRPRINSGELEAKASFAKFVMDECANADVDISKSSLASNGWASNNTTAVVCVERIAAYAADQCIMITRRQNVVAGDANLALGAVTLGTGGAALYYALKGPSEKDSEALLASAATASNTGRGFLPTTASLKVSDLLSGALIYAEYSGVSKADIEAIKAFKLKDDHGKRSPALQRAAAAEIAKETDFERSADYSMVKLARVHDAVFAACGANAYGVVPAAKPNK
ncbi:hypothetical protein [Sphingomonas nostoxanthinifaciens]|uniref:hypothetical protein n=1 Tax=Sphingomonas nostoxanthinifaciens TaxID=2872652 RepID=UPI001CC20FE2|nr:hypothetical protein [Sphingomonas nostoxanthinifaciens]UAK25755.1 hypothetical protein K8P63_06380 [Sphingomonas nostoxanthinifaciens]